LILQISFAKTGGGGEEIIANSARYIAVIGGGEAFAIYSVADFKELSA
jgi:hypothetical protein